MALWETFENRYVIQARLVAQTALRVGTGGDETAQPSASDLPVLKGADDQPYIPGSSLRGVIRSQLERIVRTLEENAGDGVGACDPTSEQRWCITDKRMKDWMEDLRKKEREDTSGKFNVDTELAERVWKHSCRVCRVFGSPWLASRVRITDLHLHEGTISRIERRDGVAIDREKETVQNKYDFEIVPRETAFALCITAENLVQAERGLLWLGLRELQDGHVLLGGFKGRGLGRATLDMVLVQGVERRDLKAYLLKGAMPKISDAECEDWLSTFVDELGNGGK